MSDPHIIEFARCRAEVYPDTHFLRTVFFYDLSYVNAAPQTNAEYIAKAAAWGHTSPWEMCVMHEVGHSFVAAQLGYDYSPALFAEAHGVKRPSEFHKREEMLVIAFQRHVVVNHPWPVWMTFPLRQVLQSGVAAFRDLVGGITSG